MIRIKPLDVSSIVIANDPHLAEFVVVWALVIANDPIRIEIYGGSRWSPCAAKNDA